MEAFAVEMRYRACMEMNSLTEGADGLTRREALVAGTAAAVPALARSGRPGDGRPPQTASRWTLWYRQPAVRWTEALPVGTGRLGAMVYGGTAVERLQLNEDTLWSGKPYDPARSEALEALPQVRRLLFDGRYAEAQELADAKMMARPLRQPPYETLGELRIAMTTGEPETGSYARLLDLDRAEAVTCWRASGREVRRTVIASPADQVIMLVLEADEGPLAVEVDFPAGESAYRDGIFWKAGRNRSAEGLEGALRFAVGVRPVGAEVKAVFDSGKLRLRASSRVTVLIAARTSYRNWREVDADAELLVRKDLDAAARYSPDQLLDRHLGEHRRLFRGFDIDLGADPFPGTATDDRIRYSHDTGRDDPFLAALYVQYGRYLLLSSSRPGSQPANLQGIWNDSNSPPWGSKYTLNINTQMNYWPAEPLALGECVEPLIRMVEELAQSGARTARTNYGARGWVAHHNTDLWRGTAPIDGAFWGLWPMGGAWLCKHLWDRWEFGRDRELLKRIYPVMRGAGLFFLDTLAEHPDGSGLVTSPSISPENAHHPGITIAAGPAMDRQILRELFRNIVSASEILSVDPELREHFASAARRLPADRVGKAGQLQEWLEDWDLETPDIQHRHISHLYGLYPGDEIGPETAALYKAARRSLEIRGDDATGWGLGWRINLWARLGDAGRAYTVVRKLLGPERTYPNLFDAHPPFQIDGNFGGAAGIAEMIVRDRPQVIDLLPALPPQWKAGSLHGLRLRGGARLDLTWTDGAIASARFTSPFAWSRPVSWNGRTSLVSVPAGGTASLRV
jgi:alpha-L-fucosidase 2